MKTNILVIALLFLSVTSFSQDTIFYKNGQVIPAIIIEKNNTEIRYKKADSPQSEAIYSVFISDISSIHYSTGIIADYSDVSASLPGDRKVRPIDEANTLKVMKVGFGGGIDYFNRNESDALLRFWRDKVVDPGATIEDNPLSWPVLLKFGAQFNRVAFGTDLQLRLTPKDAIYASEFNGAYELMLRNFYYNITVYFGRTINHNRTLLLVGEAGVDLTTMSGNIRLNNTDYELSFCTGKGYHIAAGLDWHVSKRFTAIMRGGYRSSKAEESHKNEFSTTGWSTFYVDHDVSDELLTVSWKGPYLSAGLVWSFYFRLPTD